MTPPGLVLGLEMSRLSRSCKDWHQLLELCALFGALLADQDGVYDPSDPNDKLVLGLKGQISELERHTIRSRLVRGMLNKARRGELNIDAPIGYVKTPAADRKEIVRALVERVTVTVAGDTESVARPHPMDRRDVDGAPASATDQSLRAAGRLPADQAAGRGGRRGRSDVP